MTSSVSPCLRTSATETPFLFSCSRTSARALRAAAAFSSAAARCSGVRSGRGMVRPNRLVRGRWTGPAASVLVAGRLDAEPHGQPRCRQIRWSRAFGATSLGYLPEPVTQSSGSAVTFRVVRWSGASIPEQFRMSLSWRPDTPCATRRRRHADGALSRSSSAHRSTAARSPAGRDRRRAPPATPSGRRRRPVPKSRRRSAGDPPWAPSPGASTGPPRPSRSRRGPAASPRRPRRRSPCRAEPARPGRARRRCRPAGRRPPSPVFQPRTVSTTACAPTAAVRHRVLDRAGVGVGGQRQHEQPAAVQARGVDAGGSDPKPRYGLTVIASAASGWPGRR